jgi:hypothetical protein
MKRMKNYVLICNINDKNSEADLLNKVEELFPKHRRQLENGITFLSFAHRQLPEVMDKIRGIMDSLTIQDNDYIAIYYTRKEEPDLINRVMLVGTDSQAETTINGHMSSTVYENVLKDLFEFNFEKDKV